MPSAMPSGIRARVVAAWLYSNTDAKNRPNAKVHGAAGGREVALFHCGIDYPLPFETVNLRAMQTMMTTLGLPVGYSDHTEGTLITAVAVATMPGIMNEWFSTYLPIFVVPDRSKLIAAISEP